MMPGPIARFVLDTDTLSYILRRNPAALEKMRQATEQQAELYLCPVVYYEVHRGLLYRDAKRQHERFEKLAAALRWMDFDRKMWEAAAFFWAEMRRKGHGLKSDADILIAAYARILGATVVTHNTADFAPLNVAVTDWAE